MPPTSHVSQRTSASFSSTSSLVPKTTRPSASSLSTSSPTPVTHSPPSADKCHATVSLPSYSPVILQQRHSHPRSLHRPVCLNLKLLFVVAELFVALPDIQTVRRCHTQFRLLSCFRCRVPIAENKRAPY